MKKNFQNAFSLMEMMVVLLIVSIVAAATAPMVTKKMIRSAGSTDSPWLFTGIDGSIVYNMNKADVSAIIGSSSYSAGENEPTRPRLVLSSGNDVNHPALAFADGDGKFSGQITMDKTTGIVALSNSTVGKNSVAIGMGQTIDNKNCSSNVAIGYGVKVKRNCSVAIGHNTEAGYSSVAIGGNNWKKDDAEEDDAAPSYTIAIGESALPKEDYAVVIGYDTYADNSSIAIGTKASSAYNSSIAIGTRASGSGKNSIAIGSGAKHFVSDSSIAIGNGANTTLSKNSIAIGSDAKISINNNSIAIGKSALTSYDYSTAIGAGANTTAAHQIVLGTKDDTVYVPGNLVVGRTALLNLQKDAKTIVRRANGGNELCLIRSGDLDGGDDNLRKYPTDASENAKAVYNQYVSDRRLKNVGEKYTAGLDELKKLDFYNYTFKKDENKTPLVGVMAQDLQKVFPDAVTKGEDGYLRIRLEDMFYAVINAVKELDAKISEIVTTFDSKLDSQNQRIESLEKQNSELQKQNEELQEEIKDIEKRIKKLET